MSFFQFFAPFSDYQSGFLQRERPRPSRRRRRRGLWSDWCSWEVTVSNFLIPFSKFWFCFLMVDWSVGFRTRILRHMASELNLDMRSDGYVRVRELLRLNLTTFAKVPLKDHTVEEIREVSFWFLVPTYRTVNFFGRS